METHFAVNAVSKRQLCNERFKKHAKSITMNVPKIVHSPIRTQGGKTRVRRQEKFHPTGIGNP